MAKFKSILTTFFISLLVNAFLKVLAYLIKKNMEGEPVPEEMREPFMEIAWCCNRFHTECAVAGFTPQEMMGVQPADWTGDESVLDARLKSFGIKLPK